MLQLLHRETIYNIGTMRFLLIIENLSVQAIIGIGLTIGVSLKNQNLRLFAIM
jgi:hypothetical protein